MTMNEQEDALKVTISKRGLSITVKGRQIALGAIIALTLLGVLALYHFGSLTTEMTP
jgi:hypothetical protein